MKTTRIIRHFGVGFLATFSLLAEAGVVTVNGTNYDLTTVTGTFFSKQSTLESQLWWGNTSLADSLAAAFGGIYDPLRPWEPLGLGPKFATSYTPGSNVYGSFFVNGSVRSGFQVTNPQNNASYTWAIINKPFPTTITNPDHTLNQLTPNGNVQPIFDGGTLLLTSDHGYSAQDFEILYPRGGTLASSDGAYTDFVGNFTGNGGLTITGKGIVNLMGNNDYKGKTTVSGYLLALSGNFINSGGIQVNPGGNLYIEHYIPNLGRIDLVGSRYLRDSPAMILFSDKFWESAPEALKGQIMKANGRFTLAGDPTISIPQGRTLIIDSSISDGVYSGDLVVTGGGTLNLTAANTYSGPTAIDPGSTLALVGANASLASVDFYNNGTFDISQAAQHVTLQHDFTSGANSILNMAANQTLNVGGKATLDGSLGLVGNALKPSRWTLLTANDGITGRFNSVQPLQPSRLGYLLNYDANNVYLTLTANAADTQAALQANAAALQGIYAIQTGTINNSLTYDCSYFDSKGFCLSTGGRYSNASNSHANTTSAMVVGGYRVDNHTRIGGYVDQNLYNTEAGSVASLRSNTPLLGVFAVWNENPDQTGFEAKLAAGYNNSSMDINRVAVGTSELGYGKAGIDTLSGSGTLSYGFRVAPNWVASPYLGVRHTTVSTSAYTEQADLISPLTYAGLNQESLTALVGLRASGRLTDQIGLQASAGLEQDMHNYTSRYTATGLDGLTSIDFSPNMQKSRLATSFGASYDLAKGHRIGLTGIYRQESFQSVDTKMAYLTYTMGF
jgi:autotransporter-associated beta strand protein